MVWATQAHLGEARLTAAKDKYNCGTS